MTDTRYPLFIVTGSSGAGKTTILPLLRELLPGVAVFDKDHMWAADWGQAYDNFFRMAEALAAGGIHTVVVGTIIPEHFVGYACQERDRVGEIHYINVHCSDAIRESRLLARPASRKSSDPAFIEEHARLAARLLADELPQGSPTVDTSSRTPREAAELVAGHIEHQIRSLAR